MEDARALPLRPIWPAIKFNTALYAAILWAVFVLPGVLRRKRREQRGLCIHCAYDLRGAAPDSPNCRDCGEPLARLER